jgi:hypothetical protein
MPFELKKRTRQPTTLHTTPTVAAATAPSPATDDIDWIETKTPDNKTPAVEDLFGDELDDIITGVTPKQSSESNVAFWLRATTQHNPLPLGPQIPPQVTSASLSTAKRPVGQSDHVLREVLRTLKLCTDNPPIRPSTVNWEEAVKHITLFTADFEDVLLTQAGPRASPRQANLMVDLPACCFGTDCVGLTQRIQGFNDTTPGVILMSCMTPDELRHLYETGRKPKVPLPCLLCIRYTQGKLFENICCGDIQIHQSITTQIFYNKVDEPNGYLSQYVHVPNKSRWDGTRLPIAKFLPNLLHAFQMKEGHWCISQERMRFFV